MLTESGPCQHKSLQQPLCQDTMLSGKRALDAGSTTLRRNGGLIRPRNALASSVGAGDLQQQTPLGAAGATARRSFSAMQAPLPKASALPSYVLNCPETQVTTLPNGLRVASEVRLARSLCGCCRVFCVT